MHAGWPGLLRIFVVVTETHFYEEAPAIRVVVTSDGGTVEETLMQEAPGILTEVQEGELTHFYNLLIPGEIIRQGLEIDLTYDPDDEIAGLEGHETLTPVVVGMPVLNNVFVPVINNPHPRNRYIEWVDRGGTRLTGSLGDLRGGGNVSGADSGRLGRHFRLSPDLHAVGHAAYASRGPILRVRAGKTSWRRGATPMRPTITFLLLAVLAGCAEQLSKSAEPDAPRPNVTEPDAAGALSDAVATALAADYPRVMPASPEVTNYTHPDWPLKPGDRITPDQRRKLAKRFGYDEWGRTAVVWVVRGTDLAGALPFGAWYTSESGVLPEAIVQNPSYMFDRMHYMYHGHFPAATMNGDPPEMDIYNHPKMEQLMPPSLSGIVDHGKLAKKSWEAEDLYREQRAATTAAGLDRDRSIATSFEALRKRYYGHGVSW